MQHQVIGMDDIYQICEKVRVRQEKFAEEELRWSIGIVLMNYGDQYVRVTCVGPEEWKGTKGQLSPREGIPLCPNGHPMLEMSDPPKLSLVWED